MEKDYWQVLQNYTNARIARGRAGNALPTNEVLEFRMAHALARDAVYSILDVDRLKQDVQALDLVSVEVQSQAGNGNDFLLNPNKGRQLDELSVERLSAFQQEGFDLCIILGDGLSANAVNQHAINVLQILQSALKGWSIAPIVIAQQARVALSDVIGEQLRAQIVLILIGERPGLSSPNSMGAYITYGPQNGNTDEKRNCISNIQPEGLSYPLAASKIVYLLEQIKRLQLSGVNIKDDFDILGIDTTNLIE